VVVVVVDLEAAGADSGVKVALEPVEAVVAVL